MGIEPFDYQKRTNIEEHNQIVDKLNEVVDAVNNIGPVTDEAIKELAVRIDATEQTNLEQDSALATLGQRVGATEGNVTGLSEDVTGLTGQVEDLETETTNLDGRVTDIDGRLTTLAGNHTVLAGRVDSIDSEVGQLSTEVGDLELGKVNVAQGAENAGKFLSIDDDGNVTPAEVISGAEWTPIFEDTADNGTRVVAQISLIPNKKIHLKVESSNILEVMNWGDESNPQYDIRLKSNFPIESSAYITLERGEDRTSPTVSVTWHGGVGKILRWDEDVTSEFGDIVVEGAGGWKNELQRSINDMNNAIYDKVDKNQGSGYAGKVLGIDSSGYVTPIDPPSGWEDIKGLPVASLGLKEGDIVEFTFAKVGLTYSSTPSDWATAPTDTGTLDRTYNHNLVSIRGYVDSSGHIYAEGPIKITADAKYVRFMYIKASYIGYFSHSYVSVVFNGGGCKVETGSLSATDVVRLRLLRA